MSDRVAAASGNTAKEISVSRNFEWRACTLVTMTTLINDHRTTGGVDVAGVMWPVRKLAAVVVAVFAVVVVLGFGGTLEAAAWVAGGAALIVWWGGYVAVRRRWEHGRREHAAAHRIDQY